MAIVDKISCVHCGAPIQFSPGEIVATCRYCGFTQVIETGRPFSYEHSMFLNKLDDLQVEERARMWMRGGFVKPGDLARASRIVERNIVYVPFWILEIKATTTYKGVFERITPPVVKEGRVAKVYDWLVLARKATEFPTREFDLALEGKVPFDFRRIERSAKVLNSEVEKSEAVTKAKQEIEAHHKFLIREDVDRIIEADTAFEFQDVVYIHAPVWFLTYEYEKEKYQMILDGASGEVIKGDVPSTNLGLF
jgi:hypothetical protein